MAKPAGPATNPRSNILQPKKIPKSLVVLFVLTQFLFGVNYGFFAAVSSKRWRALAYFGSVLNVLIIMTAFAYNFANDANHLDPMFAVNFLCVFITTHVSKYKLQNFITDIMAIDETYSYNVDLNSHIGLKTCMAVVYVFCYRLVISGLFCAVVKCLERGKIHLIMYVVYEMTHVFYMMLTVVTCMIFYIVYLRVKFLKSAFEQGEHSTEKIMSFFKSLADCLNKIRVSEDISIVLRFVVDFITIITYVWEHFKWLKESFGLSNYVFMYVDTVHVILLTCVPAMVAEMVAVQMDKMKWLIHERLLIEINDKNSKELIDLLRYIEARPLTYKAWRLVPVDLRQPVLLLSMTATYLVVLVQLTHMY